jgi:hypothetical protein
MSDDKTDSAYRSSLPKLTDDGNNNNYGDWATKAFHNLRTWNLWKYIEGPTSVAPIIPTLTQPQTHHGVDDHGNIVTVHVPGNQTEYDDAVKEAQPWTDANNLCLTKIINAVPSHRMHLIKRLPYAKQAWQSLQSTYQPRNTLRAATLKTDITAFRCQPHMDVVHWLNDMQQFFNTLCDIDPDAMTDSAFAIAILDNMPQDISWRPFLSGKRKTVRDYETHVPPILLSSIEFITSIREEYWFRQRDNPQANAHVFTTSILPETKNPKRPRPSTTSSAPPPAKRLRNTDKQCSNPLCGSKRGHEIQDCMAYGGGNQGKYAEWWKGPWNIHLPPDQRTRSNNTPPTSHPAYAQFKSSAPKPTVYYAVDSSTSRADSSPHPDTLDDKPHINAVLSHEIPSFVSETDSGNDVIVASLPILSDTSIPNQSCYYDCGANRHVFHDRAAFETYDTIPPLSVKGFGHHLSTVAIGRGTVRLLPTYGDHPTPIVLNHVLHIPAARSNLISGIQLDKAGVTALLGNGSATLSLCGTPIATATIENNMYRLNVHIVPPTPTLLSRISPLIMSSSTHQSNFYTA